MTPTKAERLRAKGWLTLDELVEVLVSRGVFLGRDARRTVRFYQAQGLIDKPVKTTGPGGQAHVAYYSPATVRKIEQIRRKRDRAATDERKYSPPGDSLGGYEFLKDSLPDSWLYPMELLFIIFDRAMDHMRAGKLESGFAGFSRFVRVGKPIYDHIQARLKVLEMDPNSDPMFHVVNVDNE